MDKTFFENLDEILIENISKASISIHCAVAWITDSKILSILENKIFEEVDVQVIVMDDNFNKDYFKNYNFLKENINLYYRNSHHKYCILDNSTLISGSFNWTIKAKTRINGENILLSDNKALVEKFTENFYSLIKNDIETIDFNQISGIPLEEYKFYDRKGNVYRFVKEYCFVDINGNEFDFFGDGILFDGNGDFVNEDGSVSQF